MTRSKYFILACLGFFIIFSQSVLADTDRIILSWEDGENRRGSLLINKSDIRVKLGPKTSFSSFRGFWLIISAHREFEYDCGKDQPNNSAALLAKLNKIVQDNDLIEMSELPKQLGVEKLCQEVRWNKNGERVR